jgi:C-terminal processing protease CtpA/Prc
MTNEAILDQQDIKNQDAAQTMEEQLDKATKEAEDAHTAYFAKRHTDKENYNATQEAILWNRYIKAHTAEQEYLYGKIDKGSVFDIQVKSLAKEMGIDPNDYQEDDKEPRGPGDQQLEDSYK